jgi:isopropylmalate/homocitrate/citramalate synthase
MAMRTTPIWWRWLKKPWEGPWGQTGVYNWADEITKNWKIPEKIELHDCTFRDGEQCTLGAPYNKQDYIDIASAMSDWGMHRYEIMPAVSPVNYEAAKEISGMGLKAEMWGFCRARKDDVQAAIDIGMKGVIIELSAHGYLTGTARWKPEQMVQMMLDASTLAKDAGLRATTFYPVSVTCSWDELYEFVYRTSEIADGYCTVDTTGVLTPEGTAFFTDMVRSIRPEKRLESHAHNINALGVANSITAVAHGVGAVHCEMLGFTLPPAQEVAINIYQMLGKDIGINWEMTREVCELISERAKVPISPARPFIGPRLGYGQVGIADHAQLDNLKDMEERLKKGEEITEPARRRSIHDLLGISRKKTLGKQNGRWTMNLKLWCMGIPEVSYPDECAKILEKVENLAIEHKLYEVSDADFLKIYEEVMGHPPPPPEERKIPEVIKRGLGPIWQSGEVSVLT